MLNILFDFSVDRHRIHREALIISDDLERRPLIIRGTTLTRGLALNISLEFLPPPLEDNRVQRLKIMK